MYVSGSKETRNKQSVSDFNRMNVIEGNDNST